MPETFQYVAHPHISRRAAGPPKVADARTEVHGTGPVGRFNSALGLRITVVVGTMWAAYVFAGIALISLPDNIHSTQTLILWISSSFLQLVLLPIIIVGQNIQARAADKRAEATYNDADAILHEAKQIQAHLMAQDRELEKILGMARGAS
jgi:hypothetical protein